MQSFAKHKFRHLSFALIFTSRAGGYFIYNQYGSGEGPIWLDEVQCSGAEQSIADCAHLPWGQHNCQHYEDVSIGCCKKNRIPLSRNSMVEQLHLGSLHDCNYNLCLTPTMIKANHQCSLDAALFIKVVYYKK